MNDIQKCKLFIACTLCIVLCLNDLLVGLSMGVGLAMGYLIFTKDE